MLQHRQESKIAKEGQTSTVITAGLSERRSWAGNDTAGWLPTPITYRSTPPGTPVIWNPKSHRAASWTPGSSVPAASVWPAGSATRTAPPAWTSLAAAGASHVPPVAPAEAPPGEGAAVG